MSFFGQSNNNNNNQQQQQPTGFGAFGSTSNTGSGFGQPSNTAFGTATTNFGGGLFGGGNSTFGSGGSGFGAPSSSTPFGGNRPAFGGNSTSSSGMFGTTTATAGGSGGLGGFGGTNTSNNSGGLFGGNNKPAFGTGATAGGSIFGGGSSGGVFGTTPSQPTGAFGAPISSALGVNTAESQGTGSTPFQVHTEKESGANLMNHFHSISFMQPYKNYSFEELRQADYNQGRKYGNGSGQPGAFGTSTNFGGFAQQNNSGSFGGGSTGGGLFNTQPASTASPFGPTQTASSGFGGGGGIFGGAKPAATSLFGSANTSAATSSGGLFNTAPSTGFGTAPGGFGTTGGGGFGGNAQPPQPDKGGFSFGGAGTSNTFGAAAGGTNSTSGGGIFGGGQGTSGFGGQQQQQQQQQQGTANPFGNFSANQPQGQTANTSGFGFGGSQPAPKSGGIFGVTPSGSGGTGAGLFGNLSANNAQQPQAGSIFGANSNNPIGGGSLFGPKPPATGGSIFGVNPTNTTTTGGSGLFNPSGFGTNNNSTQNQHNQGSSLFNGNQQQQQQPKLFGTGSSTLGGGLFNTNSNPQQQATGSSIFGNMGSNPQSSLFATSNNATNLFPNSTQQPNALQPPQPQIATALDPSPYGSASIFTGLPPPPQMNAGPIATPISIATKLRKSTVLPQYKINPIQASRLVTPQKRGFGFSYSTYGTPSSIASITSTPGGLGSSLLNGSIGRGLGKSLSTSNLRRSFDPDGESILSAGAFSAGSSRFAGSGSLKKLTIDRSLRTDLFGNQGNLPSPSSEKVDQARGILKKKVSFDASAVGGDGNDQTESNGDAPNDFAMEASRNNAEPTAQEQGFLRSSSRGGLRTLGPKANGVLSHSEMESVKGNELAIVHEDDSSETAAPAAPAAPHSTPNIPQSDPQPGPYWMKPSKEELNNLSREQLERVEGFSVGRDGCGHVEFDEPVDLTLTSLDDIYQKIALIELRSLTVYPDSNLKPSVGQGMNVPSTIFLENSWPRLKDHKTPSHETSGPRFNRHVDRLRKVTGTEFVRYETDTGTWVFKVPHFTTYSLEYDDTWSEGDTLETSPFGRTSGTPTPKGQGSRIEYTPAGNTTAQSSSAFLDEESPASSRPDDTFEFRKKRGLPGAFGQSTAFGDDNDAEDIEHVEELWSGEDMAGSASDEGADEPSDIQNDSVEAHEQSVVIENDEMDMAGSFPHGELENSDLNTNGAFTGHRSIMKVDERGQIQYGTPAKPNFNHSGDWAEQLQRTVSPRKQDRQALRRMQDLIHDANEDDYDRTPTTKHKSGNSEKPLATSIDLMNSLFGKQEAQRSGRRDNKVLGEKGFKWPYPKESQIDKDNMSEADQLFHKSFKPHWGLRTTLLYAMPTTFNSSTSNPHHSKSILYHSKGTFVSEGRDVRFAKFMPASTLASTRLAKQRASTRIKVKNGVPFAEPLFIPFEEIASGVSDKTGDEVSVWELAAILFDKPVSSAANNDFSDEHPADDHYARKDRLIQMWRRLCQPSAMKDVSSAPNAEEKAVAQLSANNIVEACDELIQGRDFRLAILLAQIGGGEVIREDMAFQMKEWRGLHVLSEITDPIRALYELLSGNTCFCEGAKGPLEDNAKSFVISERFGLDWRRAFGLRLWYAISAEEPLEVAVKKYALDLEGHESKKPVPPFQKGQIANLWEDKNRSQREDVLWGILKLYAAAQTNSTLPSIADIVMPHNTSGNPLGCRLSFQLYHALSLRFPPTNLSYGDQLARDFAVQLDSIEHWLDAMFVLLHLSDYRERQQLLQRTLAPHAHEITDAEHPTFKILTNEFQIPASWIWEAKALHARCVTQNEVHEVHFLLLASNWAEAHHRLCTTVAPRAVIEEDLTTLKQLLDAFHDGKRHVSNWMQGGQVYEDFEQLANGASGRERAAVLKRLAKALPRMLQEQARQPSLEELAAVKEMSGVVAQTILEGEDGNKLDAETSSILQLPLAGDMYMAHTLQIAMRYYRDVLAAS